MSQYTRFMGMIMKKKNFWEIKNNELVARFEKYSDKEVVELLWQGDDDAWEYLYLRAVIPVLKTPQIFAIMKDRERSLSSRDVLGMVFKKLLAEKKLALYAFRCPVVFWVRKYVRGAILYFCKKNSWPVSDEDYLRALNTEETPTSFKEELEDAEKCFVKLWRTNPMRAYVHLLRIQEKMSSKDIKKLLNISSDQNVNKYFERACEDMRMFRDKLEKGEAL